MAYTVLARRYRSRDFSEVVGQEPVARTLAAAIEAGRVAHAYLFCGTRGVGKTSMARIFAKALNTPDDAPLATDVAEAVMQGRDTDVIEIDAASNRGVDEARELIAGSVYRPMRGRYKIYIIDEVHMLTREAFNALLKTMEEPPEHVKFILCTTEPQKVPATIQSRCQRFDFRAISSRDIAAHLTGIIESEGLEAQPELVMQVARLGSGSMRDALSLLDRLMASGEKTLTTRLLAELLGLPDAEIIATVIDAALDEDPASALNATDDLLKTGASPEQTLEALATRLRDCMVLAACGPETELVESSGAVREADAARAARLDPGAWSYMIAICDSVSRTLRQSACQRPLLDAAIVRLALVAQTADAAAVLTGAPHATTLPAGAPAKKH